MRILTTIALKDCHHGFDKFGKFGSIVYLYFSLEFSSLIYIGFLLKHTNRKYKWHICHIVFTTFQEFLHHESSFFTHNITLCKEACFSPYQFKRFFESISPFWSLIFYVTWSSSHLPLIYIFCWLFISYTPWNKFIFILDWTINFATLQLVHLNSLQLPVRSFKMKWIYM